MITYLALLKKREEHEQLLTIIRKYAAVYTDELWSYLYFQDVSQTERLLETEPVLDLISWDVTIDGALPLLKKMRRQYQKAFLIIIADMSVSPMAYLRPGIAPGALLLEPVGRNDIEKVVKDLFEVFIGDLQNDQIESFLVETREGRQYIPITQIDCFEAKEKKVFVRTKSCEYGFYDTLDELENRLPVDFMRCHRSYIVNLRRAESLNLAESLIRMMDGVQIPFSRSYKKILKEHFNNV